MRHGGTYVTGLTPYFQCPSCSFQNCYSYIRTVNPKISDSIDKNDAVLPYARAPAELNTRIST